MQTYQGSLFLLEIEDENTPETYLTIAGMRENRFEINNSRIDASDMESGKWRELVDNGGVSHVTMTGSGIFVDSESEKQMRQHALNNEIKSYKMRFENGDYLSGNFQITSYARQGNHRGDEVYAVTLESSGAIIYGVSA
ncbi:MAG: phage major tail protein, TP901-1 family [Alphaproteobacteria bacterium CG11_big_fil_rev_8_21_14_0_20_44_7]|nr:MAG: phage major tail protein, TP901-1 family [Alphaproteobacteria bacterium CG11_big_fil_rev_8_21_14_0_20_44_7]